MNQVKENIEVLKKAQEIDRELYTTRQFLKEIPAEKAELKRALELEKNHLNELEASLKKLQLKQKEKEGELAQKEAGVKKLDGQLGQVKTNKEYAALQQEIASLKADNSLLEEDIIKIMDEVEAVHEEVRTEQNRLKQTSKEFEAKEAELSQKEKTCTGKVDELQKAREESLRQIAPDVRSLYDRVVEKKQGLALIRINGEVCGACQMQLRPQLINEVRLAENIIVCENCSRILYFEEA